MSTGDHFCHFVVKWPKNQSDTFQRCDAPASIKRGNTYLCAQHFDEIESGALEGWATITDKGME